MLSVYQAASASDAPQTAELRVESKTAMPQRGDDKFLSHESVMHVQAVLETQKGLAVSAVARYQGIQHAPRL